MKSDKTTRSTLADVFDVLGILGLIAGGIMAIGFFTASMSSCGLAFAWSLPDYCCLHLNRMLFTEKKY